MLLTLLLKPFSLKGASSITKPSVSIQTCERTKLAFTIRSDTFKI